MDSIENISVSHIDMLVIVNRRCWEVISFNQCLAGWETTFITVQMDLPAGFHKRLQEER